MSAKALFAVNGDPYICVTQRITDSVLDRSRKQAATAAWEAIVSVLKPGESELGFRWTDRMLAQTARLREYSLRYVQKGLNALHELDLIDRLRRRGRRRIVVLGRLAAGSKAPSAKQKRRPEARAPDLAQTIPMAAPSRFPHPDTLPEGEGEPAAYRLLNEAAALGWGLEPDELKGNTVWSKLRQDAPKLDRELVNALSAYRQYVLPIIEAHGGRYPPRE
jgi:hypothetical protein